MTVICTLMLTFARYKISNMAAERSRRHNAGNKMSRLLEAEDEDDFYKTTYGGFSEVRVALLYIGREKSTSNVEVQ